MAVRKHSQEKERTDSWIRERFKGFEKEGRITVCGRLQSRPFSVLASRLLNQFLEFRSSLEGKTREFTESVAI